MDAPEAELVRQAKRGERQAFVQLLAKSGPVARQAISGMISPSLRSLLSPDDVMQQAYTDAFLVLLQFKYTGPGSFDRWLITLAKRNCVDGIRALQAAKRGGKQDRIQTHEDSVASLMDLVAGVSATPSRFAAGNEARTALEAGIRQLPTLYEHVVRRLDLEQAGVSEVAEELGRSPGAVYMLRERAHDRLKGIMGSASRFLSDGA